MSDPIDLLSRSLDRTESIIEGIRPEQMGLPTPCSAWNVRELVEHVIGDLRQFGSRAGADPVPDLHGDAPSMAYRSAADALVRAWGADGALDRKIETRMGEITGRWLIGQATADVLVHGWDLAKATGQATDIDGDLGEYAVQWGQENLRPEFRGDEQSGKSFGNEVSVSQDAPVQDRLAGVFGRDPNWEPPEA